MEAADEKKRLILTKMQNRFSHIGWLMEKLGDLARQRPFLAHRISMQIL